jgi:hypothetical protein
MVKQLTATQLQHLLKKPPDGVQPPKVTLYEPRFEVAVIGFLGCACIFSAGLFNHNRMAAPGKITAS